MEVLHLQWVLVQWMECQACLDQDTVEVRQCMEDSKDPDRDQEQDQKGHKRDRIGGRPESLVIINVSNLSSGAEFAEAGGAERGIWDHATDRWEEYHHPRLHEECEEHHRHFYGGHGHGRHHGKAKLSHEILGGAAGFEAMRLFQQYHQRHGHAGNHKKLKEIASGFAVAEAVKVWEQHHGRRHRDEEGKREVAARAAATSNALYEQRYMSPRERHEIMAEREMEEEREEQREQRERGREYGGEFGHGPGHGPGGYGPMGGPPMTGGYHPGMGGPPMGGGMGGGMPYGPPTGPPGPGYGGGYGY